MTHAPKRYLSTLMNLFSNNEHLITGTTDHPIYHWQKYLPGTNNGDRKTGCILVKLLDGFVLKEINLVIFQGWEKAMATHTSTLAWKIPWTEEPGRLQSMGSLRVGHDWATSLSLFTFMHWRRKWQPTPVFLPGESQGRGSLVGCRLWGRTESDTTEAT